MTNGFADAQPDTAEGARASAGELKITLSNQFPAWLLLAILACGFLANAASSSSRTLAAAAGAADLGLIVVAIVWAVAGAEVLAVSAGALVKTKRVGSLTIGRPTVIPLSTTAAWIDHRVWRAKGKRVEWHIVLIATPEGAVRIGRFRSAGEALATCEWVNAHVAASR